VFVFAVATFAALLASVATAASSQSWLPALRLAFRGVVVVLLGSLIRILREEHASVHESKSRAA